MNNKHFFNEIFINWNISIDLEPKPIIPKRGINDVQIQCNIIINNYYFISKRNKAKKTGKDLKKMGFKEKAYY